MRPLLHELRRVLVGDPATLWDWVKEFLACAAFVFGLSVIVFVLGSL